MCVCDSRICSIIFLINYDLISLIRNLVPNVLKTPNNPEATYSKHGTHTLPGQKYLNILKFVSQVAHDRDTCHFKYIAIT